MASWNQDDGDLIDDRIVGIDPVNIIVDFDHTPTGDDIQALTDISDTINFQSKYVNAVWMDAVDPTQLPSIVAIHGVLMVELAEGLQVVLDTSAEGMKARAGYHSPETAEDLGFTGFGINIAVLDTGVDNLTHESLDDLDDNTSTVDPKFVAGMNATLLVRTGGELVDPADDHATVFHGTHVAGIALGTGGPSGTNRGIAPAAKLVDVKVCDSTGSCSNADVAAAIEWCIDNRNTDWTAQAADHDGIDVLNLSLGSNRDSDGQGALSQLLNRAVDLGLVVVVAAGNWGPNAGLGPIAAADRVLTIANLDDNDTETRTDDALNNTSSRGPRADDGDSDSHDELKPDVAAPGTLIMSADGGVDPTAYHELTGTSMASPHVAGLAALMLENDPGYTADLQLLKDQLRCTSEDKNGVYDPPLDPRYDVNYGWGDADAYAALQPYPSVDLEIKHWGYAQNPKETPSWKSDDIWLDSEPAVKGEANGVTARIHNPTNNAATGVEVHFSVNNYGASSDHPWNDLATIYVNVPANSFTDARIDWTPADTPHQCLKVTFDYYCSGVDVDDNISNNIAMENVWPQSDTTSSLQAATATVDYPIDLYNPYPTPKMIHSETANSTLPAGWSASLQSADVLVRGGDVETNVLTITHDGTEGSGTIDVNVNIVGDPIESGVTAEITVPEPGEVALLMAGAVFLMAVSRFRRSRG